MNTNVISDRPATWRETLAGVTIFIYFPILYYTLRYLIPPGTDMAQAGGFINFLVFILFLSLIFLIPLAGFTWGWIRKFPRWSYPYVLYSVIIALYIANVSTPGIYFLDIPIFGREPWGLRACVPGLVAVGICLLATRSHIPVKTFFERGWRDWTCFTFALFGFMPLVNFIAFDEINDSYELPFQAILTLIMALSAAAYLRSRVQSQRVLSLVAGIGLSTAINSLAPAVYWLENGWVDLFGTAMRALIFALFFFSPALIGLLRLVSKRSTVSHS